MNFIHNQAAGHDYGGNMNGNNDDSQSASMFPEVTFSTFIISLASSALVGLGEVPDPGSGRTSKNLSFVRHNIDVLEMLRQKTNGCLERQESSLLESLLCELKLKYVILCDPQSDKKSA